MPATRRRSPKSKRSRYGGQITPPKTSGSKTTPGAPMKAPQGPRTPIRNIGFPPTPGAPKIDRYLKEGKEGGMLAYGGRRRRSTRRRSPKRRRSASRRRSPKKRSFRFW